MIMIKEDPFYSAISRVAEFGRAVGRIADSAKGAATALDNLYAVVEPIIRERKQRRITTH